MFNCRLIFIGIAIVFVSCSTSSNKNSFSKIGELHITLPNLKQDIWSFSSSLTEIGGHEYLVYASKNDKRLNFINIKNNKKEYTISLNEVTNNFDFSYNTLNFYIHNLDSIFILPNETKSLFLIKKNGKLINEWHISKENYNYDFLLSGFVLSSFSFFNENLYVRFVPRINSFKNLEFYHTIPPELILNTKTDFIRLGGGWPEDYKTKNYYDSYPSTILNKDTIITSFEASHNIYRYYKDALIDTPKVKSDYINDFVVFPVDSVGNIGFTIKYLTISPRYGAVYYDKYRKQYYRIAFHPTEYVNEDKKTVKGGLDQPWSIIILNKDFEKQNEIAFNPKLYAYGPIFISKEGVLIPRRNIDLKKNIQQEWQFDVINLK